jgi:hypothetical protein
MEIDAQAVRIIAGKAYAPPAGMVPDQEAAEKAGVCPGTSTILPRRLSRRDVSMRKAGLGLALIASAQLTLLSSPAFAQDTSAGVTPTETSSSSTSSSNPNKKKTGWILLGVGGGVTLAGLVLDIVGTTQGHVSGAGGAGDQGLTDNTRTNFYWGGTALIVAGVVTGIVGGSMVFSKGDTKSTPTDHSSDDAKIDSVTKTAQAAYQSAPTVTLPIVGATF